LEALSSRIHSLEDAVASFGDVNSAIGRLTTVRNDEDFIEKIIDLEEHCIVLEDSTKAINRFFSSSIVAGLESRIRSFELS